MKYLILISVVFLMACKSPEKVNNSFLKESSFSDHEIHQLTLLLENFDRAVCEIENQKTNKLERCYQSLFEKLKEQQKAGIISIGFDEELQNSLYSNIDGDLSKELWTTLYSIKNKGEVHQDTLITKVLNVQGKFFQFLEKEVAKDYPIIQENVEALNKTGAMTPTFVADVLMNYDQLSIEDERVRLFIAIHYLGLNEGYLDRLKFESNKKHGAQ